MCVPEEVLLPVGPGESEEDVFAEIQRAPRGAEGVYRWHAGYVLRVAVIINLLFIAILLRQDTTGKKNHCFFNAIWLFITCFFQSSGNNTSKMHL